MMNNPLIVTIYLYEVFRGGVVTCSAEDMTCNHAAQKFSSVVGCCRGACPFAELNCPDVPCLGTKESDTSRAQRFILVRHK